MRRVVITGLGAVTPIGNDVSSFWEGLISGRCGIGPITKFNTEKHKVTIAAEVKDFDPLLYMSKNDVRRSDLYTQYAVSAAVQAMADAGLENAGLDPFRFGVYVGSGIGGVNTFFNESEKLLTKGPGRVSPLFVPMMIANIAAGTIAIRFNAKGPCLSTVTACATGTHSIGEAFRAIRHGYADAILAGGSEAAVMPLSMAGFANCMALTTRNDPQNASIPFDKRRDGFVLGEGAAVLVLEEYEHAASRGAKIYAEIVGYGSTCDAFHITAPVEDGSGAAKAIQLALQEAGHKEDDRIYINAHGTSTPLNDKTETKAIKLALGDGAYAAMISSTKSMTGHMLGAAGAAEAVATVLAVKNGVLPPTIGLNEPDEECDLDYIPHKARKTSVSLGLSISLGFGGHNAVLAVRPL
jgi:3-oxoacyl-[acyl-carrier-protein] synthase II